MIRRGISQTVDAPGAGTELGTGTSLGVLNSAGEGAGIAIDDSFLFHPFIRDPSGKVTSWDIPGSTSIVIALNDLGAVVGQWLDTSSLPHAYQHTPLGTITSFPSMPVPNLGITPMAISNRSNAE